MASHREIITMQDSIAPKLLGGKISEDSPLVDLLCSKCRLPVTDARQTIDCGCRLCGHCYTVLDDSGKRHFKCGKCGNAFDIEKTFVDKAAIRELKGAALQCFHQRCPWIGSSTFYQDHISSCQFSCPNPGCDVYTARRDMEGHLKSCTYVACEQCTECAPAALPTRYNEAMDYYNYPSPTLCSDWSATPTCYYSIKDTLRPVSHIVTQEESTRRVLATEEMVIGMSSHITTGYQQQQGPNEIHNIIMDTVCMIETMLCEVQDSLQELALLVQTLQATISYNVWKIPEVQRRRGGSELTACFFFCYIRYLLSILSIHCHYQYNCHETLD